MLQPFWIEVDHPDNRDSLHRLRNLGEALYVVFLNSDHAFVDIHEVDQATDRLRVMVLDAGYIEPVLARVNELVREHYFSATSRISLVQTRTP